MKKNIDLVIDGIAPEKVMYDTNNHSLVVLYPAQREFKKGDILASDDILLIFDEYANKGKDILHSIWNNGRMSTRNWITKYFTYATDEQITQLHKDLRKEGKRWNAETLEVEDLDISDIVIDLRSACEYLEIKRPAFFILDGACGRGEKFEAQITLQLIREAWNKYDGFVVDFEDKRQVKYSPRIDLDGKIVCAMWWIDAHNIHSACYSFKTKARAIQFGNQFKELFKTAMGL